MRMTYGPLAALCLSCSIEAAKSDLAPEAGGNSFHNGGRQFESKDDPDWKTLARWANVQKPGTSK